MKENKISLQKFPLKILTITLANLGAILCHLEAQLDCDYYIFWVLGIYKNIQPNLNKVEGMTAKKMVGNSKKVLFYGKK